jgi:putative ABC transport system ATP-binding protein
VAAAYASRVVFLADGQVAGELRDPTPQSIASRMADLGARSTRP